jgi:hypothetical protein
METGFFTSGEIELGPGAYFLRYRAICILDWDTLFSGTLQIDVRHTLDVEVISNINPRSSGVVPVAILGSGSFDIFDIDVATLQFGQGGATTKHDLTDPWAYKEHLQDLNLDGFMDLVVHFPTQDTGIACGHESATLTGETLDGQLIEGSDSLVTVGCRGRRRPAIWMKDEEREADSTEDRLIEIRRK